MKSLKEAAPAEVGAIRKRAFRELAMDRIDTEDCTYITTRLDEIEVYIKNMEERS